MGFFHFTHLDLFPLFLCVLPAYAQVPGAFPATTQGCDPNSTGVVYCPPPFTELCCASSGPDTAVCIPYSFSGGTRPICIPTYASAEGGQPASIPNGAALPSTPLVPGESDPAVTPTPPVIPGPVTAPSPPVVPGPAETVPPVSPVTLPTTSSSGAVVTTPLPPAQLTTSTLPIPIPTFGAPYFNSSTLPVGPGGATPSGGSKGSGSNGGNASPFTGAAAPRGTGSLTGWGLAIAVGIIVSAGWILDM